MGIYLELAVVYILINLVVMIMYGVDKYKAIHHRWRIPETTLIGAAVFGVFGALAGMLLFRHKIRKPEFYITVPAIMVIEVAITIAVIFCF